MNLLNEMKPIYDHEQAIELALETWYPPNHPLHSCPRHPLGKLLGEWGELLDDYMKGEYKPGYQFEPEDELGDIWYYLRILCYQKNCEPTAFDFPGGLKTDYLIALSVNELSNALIMWHEIGSYSIFALDFSYSILFEICERYNLTLDDLTTSNWEKLKPGSERGKEWMKAR